MRTILIASLFLLGCGGQARVDAERKDAMDRKAAADMRAEADAFAAKVRDSLPENQRGPLDEKAAPTSKPPAK